MKAEQHHNSLGIFTPKFAYQNKWLLNELFVFHHYYSILEAREACKCDIKMAEIIMPMIVNCSSWDVTTGTTINVTIGSLIKLCHRLLILHYSFTVFYLFSIPPPSCFCQIKFMSAHDSMDLHYLHSIYPHYLIWNHSMDPQHLIWIYSIDPHYLIWNHYMDPHFLIWIYSMDPHYLIWNCAINSHYLYGITPYPWIQVILLKWMINMFLVKTRHPPFYNQIWFYSHVHDFPRFYK